jgi:hypothetical protein
LVLTAKDAKIAKVGPWRRRVSLLGVLGELGGRFGHRQKARFAGMSGVGA